MVVYERALVATRCQRWLKRRRCPRIAYINGSVPTYVGTHHPSLTATATMRGPTPRAASRPLNLTPTGFTGCYHTVAWSIRRGGELR